jgi:hypothetical protein
MQRSPLCIFLFLALAACGGKAEEEQSPGAAERYLDNVLANETPADRAASANGADERSPSSGAPSADIGQAPVFSREPVPPRQ